MKTKIFIKKIDNGYSASFKIGCQTFSLEHADKETAKFLCKMLKIAFKKMKGENI